MRLYTVHLPPGMDAAHPALDRAAFVRDGFHFWAFLLEVLWCLWRGLWLAALGIVVVSVLLLGLGRVIGLDPAAQVGLQLVLAFLVGLEAPNLRRWSLRRRGYADAGTVWAGNLADAECRFFTRVDLGPAASSEASPRPASGVSAPRATDEVVGLFPEYRRAMTVAIVDYGSGNLHSAKKAFERAARETGLATPVEVTADPEAVRRAERVVLPGVGAFADCARGLAAVEGMTQALDEAVRRRGAPFLGICVGMQLMAQRGREYETVEGLGWIEGEVVAIEPADPSLKIPHMGWNTLRRHREHPLLAGIPAGDAGWHAYFVHSYQFKAARPEALVADTDHGGPVTAVVAKDNMAGTQFHPEKSQKLGLALIASFLRWRP